MSMDEALRRAVRGLIDDVCNVDARRTPSGWNTVLRALDRLAGALDATEPAAIETAILALEALDEVRITPVGSTPRVPPPPPVWERRSVLIHRLGSHLEDGEGADAASPMRFGYPHEAADGEARATGSGSAHPA